MTQLEYAKQGIVTPLVKKIARIESGNPKAISSLIKDGKIVIPLNKNHRISKPCGIGTGLLTKINANIGTSTDRAQIQFELAKLKAAVRLGADTVMDLSVGVGLCKTREEILRYSPVPVGTVPIYEIAVEAKRSRGDFLSFDAEDILEVLEAQAKAGVDFFTIHAGITQKSLRALKGSRRLMGIVSRGGAILASWVKKNKRENPFFEYFDRVLDIAYEYDVTLSLGDGLRPGSVLDATDKAQITELEVLGELAQRAKKRNVQVMIEGPGHVPLDQVQKNVALEKKLCHGAPFYILGPLVTDVAAGYDHISSAIGGALAASVGADFLCYVTPAEHLRHPTLQDVEDGVVAAKIAAHAADLVKKSKSAWAWDKKMSQARKARDWKRQIALSINPDKAAVYRASSQPKVSDVCTMCGDYCSIKVMEQYFKD